MLGMTVLGSDVKVERASCATLVVENVRWVAMPQQNLLLYYVHTREKRKTGM